LQSDDLLVPISGDRRSRNLDIVAISISGLAALLNAIGLLYVARQARIAGRQRETADEALRVATDQFRHVQQAALEESVRLRRVGTIDWLTQTAKQREEWQAKLPEVRDLAAIERQVELAFNSTGGDEIRRRFEACCSFYENLAVAVAAGVYDLVVLDAVDGGYLALLAENYKPYFAKAREAAKSDSWYVELEWLGQELRKVRPTGKYVLLADRLYDGQGRFSEIP
jgi:hypothetical protein